MTNKPATCAQEQYEENITPMQAPFFHYRQFFSLLIIYAYIYLLITYYY